MAKNDVKVRILGDSKDLQRAYQQGIDDTDGFSAKVGAKMVAVGNLMAQAVTKGFETSVDLIGGAFTQAFDLEDATARMQSSLGLTADEASRYGEIAGDVYSNAWGDSIDEVSGALGAIGSSFGDDADLEGLTTQALAFSDVFGEDVSASIQSAGTLLRSGLVGDGEEAFDLLTVAMQELPAGLRGELLDATEEYSQFFGALGLDGEEAFGLLVQASEDGQYGVDKMGDALKELTIRSTDMSATSIAAYESAGLSAEDMSARFLAGGDDARLAFDDLIDGLLSIEDPVEQANASIALFGTPLEDLGTAEIPDFLANLDSMDGALQGVAGSADELVDTMGGTSRATLEAFKRKALDKLADGAAALIEGFKDAWPAIQEAVEPLVEWLQEHWPKIQQGIVDFGNYLKDTFGPLVEQVFETVRIVAQRVVSWFQANWPTIRRVVEEVVRIVRERIDGIVAFITGVFESIQLLIEEGWRPAWERFKEVAVEFIDNTVDYIKELGALILEGLGNLAGVLLPKGKELLNGLWQGIQSAWDSTLLPGLKLLPGLILDGLGELGGLLLAGGGVLINGLWQGIQAAWDAFVLPAIKALPGLILDGLGALGELLLTKGGELLGGLWDGIQGVWDDTILPWLGDLGTTALLAIPGLFDSIVSRGRQLLSGLWNGIKAVWNDTIWPWLKDLGKTALLAIPGLFNSITSRGRQLLSGLWNGIKAVWTETIWPWLKNLGITALLAIPGLLNSITSRGRQLLNGLWAGIKGVWNETIWPWLKGIGSTVLLAVPSLLRTLWQSGRDIIQGFINGAGSLGSNVGSAVANGISDGFKGAWNAMARWVNNTIPNDFGLGPWKLPGPIPDLPRVSINLPDDPLPTFHSGGWVMGRSGADVPALLQEGEYVVSRAELAGSPRDDSPFAGGGLTITGGLHIGSRSDLPAVNEELERLAFRARYGVGR